MDVMCVCNILPRELTFYQPNNKELREHGWMSCAFATFFHERSPSTRQTTRCLREHSWMSCVFATFFHERSPSTSQTTRNLDSTVGCHVCLQHSPTRGHLLPAKQQGTWRARLDVMCVCSILHERSPSTSQTTTNPTRQTCTMPKGASNQPFLLNARSGPISCGNSPAVFNSSTLAHPSAKCVSRLG